MPCDQRLYYWIMTLGIRLIEKSGDAVLLVFGFGAVAFLAAEFMARTLALRLKVRR